jgi:rRNA-processing protein FCF1
MLLIVDANVLIDYLKTNTSILALAARHLGVIRVASVILDEVEQLGLEDCEDLGLTVVNEPLEILQAAADSAGALSFQDHVRLALAKSNGWICRTNDKPLRRACERDGVQVMWGLRLMIELVHHDALEVSQAHAVAKEIHAINPRHITPAILARFANEIGLGKPRTIHNE